MVVREIILYTEHKEALRKKSQAVPLVNQKIRGIGLAAPQINIHKRVMIACLGIETDGECQAGPPVVLINPKVIDASGEHRDFDGCLSFPGLYGETARPHHLRIVRLPVTV